MCDDKGKRTLLDELREPYLAKFQEAKKMRRRSVKKSKKDTIIRVTKVN